ncbi:DNA polymerase IV [Hyphococcus luteus]|uniref:DNA polymerase IV n=1 Tax=Hyphococcus luteus TaxID=2058213 RepID=A0A2S7K2E7_9PROT|nr:DNA polymerase IV [Marinicaulis flavus]PQA86673.1 DNA polymerase IV [Marinicaulis flavus]
MENFSGYSGFCRDCFAPFRESGDEAVRRCKACESVRIITHPELFSLSIAHLDCDAFYAAIEKRDDPSLEDKPVIIGGGVRGVVSTACYVARTYGVRSAMPMFKAREACPDAVIIKPNMEKYAKVGREVRKMMLDLTPMVEPLSIDEAFMDLTGTARIHGGPPAVTLARLQARVQAALGVTTSIGLSHNKFLAKMASDLDKPRGFSVIGKAETKEFLARQPVTMIWGVGRAMAAKLEQDGVKTIAQLQKADAASLAKRYGEMGLRLARLSQGEDSRAVKPERETKSVSSETTFNTDIRDAKWLEDVLWELCEKVSARMKASGFEGRTVTLKLKSADFKTITRRTTLDQPANLARVAFAAAKPMLHDAAGGKAYRLIGVGFSGLSFAGENQAAPDLFGESNEKIARTEKAIDAIREKFGRDAVKAGRTLRGPRR